MTVNGVWIFSSALLKCVLHLQRHRSNVQIPAMQLRSNKGVSGYRLIFTGNNAGGQTSDRLRCQRVARTCIYFTCVVWPCFVWGAPQTPWLIAAGTGRQSRQCDDGTLSTFTCICNVYVQLSHSLCIMCTNYKTQHLCAVEYSQQYERISDTFLLHLYIKRLSPVSSDSVTHTETAATTLHLHTPNQRGGPENVCVCSAHICLSMWTVGQPPACVALKKRDV